VAALAASALSLARAGAAEVAVLKSSDVPTWRPVVDALLRTAGGHNLTEYDLHGDRARGEEVVRALKGRVGAVVAMGPMAVELAHQLIPETPLVFCMVQDPASSRISPGPILTGVSFGVPLRNQLAAFRVVYPAASRVGVLYNPITTGRMVAEAEKAAAVVRMALVTKAIATEGEVPAALRALLAGPEPVDAVWLIPEPLVLNDQTRRLILDETVYAGKATFGFSSSLVAEGALISSGPDFTSIGEKAGELTNRLLKGERGIDVLVPRAEVAVNTKTAAKLKITIPPELLKTARTY
jgi:putative ABC transport system substrate-binding protein